MTETNRVDPETLAAFLEGRLAGDERRQVVETLAASPEDYEIMVDAARAIEQVGLREETTSDDVIDISARRRRVPNQVWFALAAVFGAVILLPRLVQDRVAESAVGGIIATMPSEASAVSLMASESAGSLSSLLGSDWNRAVPPPTRSPSGLEHPRVAFVLGELALRVDLSILAGDEASTRAASDLLQSSLDGVSGVPPSVHDLVAQWVADASVDARLDALGALEAAATESLALGYLTEATRLALLSGLRLPDGDVEWWQALEEISFGYDNEAEIQAAIARLLPALTEGTDPAAAIAAVEAIRELAS